MPDTIRPFHPSDLPALYHICLRTGKSGEDASTLFDRPELIGQVYVAPYTFHDPALCFVLTGAGKPIGYILGTRDSQAFFAWCEQQWFPILRQQFPLDSNRGSCLQQRIIERIHAGHQVDPDFTLYPAHLHIDILPEGQGCGNGRKLMHCFLAKLRELKVAGLHLQVGKSNPGAIKFYERLGFEQIKEDENSLAFGMHL